MHAPKKSMRHVHLFLFGGVFDLCKRGVWAGAAVGMDMVPREFPAGFWSGSNETPLVMEKGWAPEAKGRLKSDLDKVALERCAAVCPDTIRAVIKGIYPEKQKRIKSFETRLYFFF